jgi:hypothetical protein
MLALIELSPGGYMPKNPPISTDDTPDAQKSDKSKPQKLIDVDNPGGGDCAFYAFAIALISIVKNGGKDVFDKWVEFDPNIANYKKDIDNYDFSRQDSNGPLLNILQRSLRAIAYQVKINDIKRACAAARVENSFRSLLECSSFSVNFSPLYHNSDDVRDLDPNYNEFAIPDIRKKINTLHESIPYEVFLESHKKSVADFEVNEDELEIELLAVATSDEDLQARKERAKDEKAAEQAKYLTGFIKENSKLVIKQHEVLTLAPLFISLLYGNDVSIGSIKEETPLQENSVIYKAMQPMRNARHWGTNLELNYLAVVFNVNIHILETGEAKQEFIDDPSRYTVIVDNRGDNHWRTRVPKETTVKPTPKSTPVPGSVPVQPEPIKKTAEPICPKVHKAEPTSGSKSVPDKSTSDETKKAADEKPKSPQAKPTYTTINAEKRKQEELEKLGTLKVWVITAKTDYTNYSNKLWFSIFHHHGAAGRKRAEKFCTLIKEMTDYDEAKKAIINYLENPTYGNTHPHSFRTMLLYDVLEKKESLEFISKNYERCLEDLKTQFGTTIKSQPVL